MLEIRENLNSVPSSRPGDETGLERRLDPRTGRDGSSLLEKKPDSGSFQKVLASRESALTKERACWQDSRQAQAVRRRETVDHESGIRQDCDVRRWRRTDRTTDRIVELAPGRTPADLQLNLGESRIALITGEVRAEAPRGDLDRGILVRKIQDLVARSTAGDPRGLDTVRLTWRDGLGQTVSALIRLHREGVRVEVHAPAESAGRWNGAGEDLRLRLKNVGIPFGKYNVFSPSKGVIRSSKAPLQDYGR